MTTTRKPHWYIGSLLGLSTLISGCDLVKDIPVGTGYAAQNICSDYFVGHLNLDEVKKKFVAPSINPLQMIWNIQVDEANKTVSVRDNIFINQNLNVSVYREGFGCTLLHDSSLEMLDAQTPPPYPVSQTDAPWPFGEAAAENDDAQINYNQLHAAIATAFEEPGPKPVNTLAVVVVHQGKLVAERYAHSATPFSRMVGWSMSKSFTSTLIGILHDQGKLDVDEPAPVAEWLGTDKENIKLKDLLQMATGLEWSESAQGPTPDQGRMLFVADNHADYYAAKPVVAAPGTTFNYSTGATALLGRIVQEQVGGTLEDTYRFAHEYLFQRINIHDAILQFDTSGFPVSGAGLYMSARDWARLGLLYARNGDWFGDQVLSPEWVNFSLTPSPANSTYGSQIWLNTQQEKWPYLPADSFAFRGFHEQTVLVIPAYDLVIVRMGVTFDPGVFDEQSLVTGILASIIQ